jgi:hypothetical protein
MTYIFLGPSLSCKHAKRLLDAHYLPPASLGDILTLVRTKKPKIIALIDGYFAQTLPVWHKEILYALKEKVIVLGASSMGALRASELDRFGMIGIGKIYDMYRKKELVDDDEVALLHAPLENDYLNLSLPMINIRITLLEAASKGLLSQTQCQKWMSVAKELFYPERTLEQVALSGQLTVNETEQLNSIFKDHYVDQKKEDACTLLRHIAENRLEPQTASETLHTTPLFQNLFYQDRFTLTDNVKLTLRDLAKYIAVNHPSFSQLRMQALNRVLVSILAEILNIEVESDAVTKERERFKMQQDLMLPYDLEEWLEANDLSEAEFNQLMLERAKARVLYSSPLCGNLWRLHKALLDELKLNNQYSAWLSKAAAHQKKWERFSPYYLDINHDEIFDQALISDHIKNSEWNLDIPIKPWCEEAGFYSLQELALELHKAKLCRDI